VNTSWGSLHVLQWTGEGPVRSWPIEGAVIPQSVHTITQTRDWLIVGDCAFKVEPQVLHGGDRTEPANRSGPLYLIRKADLDSTPSGSSVPAEVIEVAPEINHYYAIHDDSDGIRILFEHTENAELSMAQREGDLDAMGLPCDPALRGLYGFPMSPDRISLIEIDGNGRRVRDRVELRDPSLLWTRQLSAMDWSAEGRERPTVHHTVHQGWRPEAVTQRTLALYGDRVDRTEWPSEETPPLVVTTSMPDLTISSYHELDTGDFPSSPIFVPRDPGSDATATRYAGSDPGGHDGYVVVPVMNDHGFRVEVYDASRVGAGPVATIAAPGVTMPFMLHSAWMPRAVASSPRDLVRFSDELDRIGELPDDLAEVARGVARDLDEGVPMQ
jgi:all-trans-8'-apo-beta-carotenal 15,15'-oxygenase